MRAGSGGGSQPGDDAARYCKSGPLLYLLRGITGRIDGARRTAIIRPMRALYLSRTDPPGTPMTPSVTRPFLAALALLTLLSAPVSGQERRVPASQAELQLSYAPLVK